MRKSGLGRATALGAFGAALMAPLGCSLLIDGELEGLERASVEEPDAPGPSAGNGGLPQGGAPVRPDMLDPAGEGGALGRGGLGGAPPTDDDGGKSNLGGEGGVWGTAGGRATSNGGEGGEGGEGGATGEAAAQWETVPGLARDLAIGADGSAWIIGVEQVAYGDLLISKWTGSAWTSANGGGTRIAVGPSGVPWIVNANGAIFRHSSDPYIGYWQLQPDLATDVAIGADGSVWIVAANDLGNNDFGIAKWNGTAWVGTDGGAVGIAVASDGVPWIVNSARQIYRRTSSSPTEGYWELKPGHASDIAAGPEGSVWIISTERIGFENFGIAVWDEQTAPGRWRSVDGAGIRIAVDPTGAPWTIDAAGQIQRARGELKRSP